MRSLRQIFVVAETNLRAALCTVCRRARYGPWYSSVHSGRHRDFFDPERSSPAIRLLRTLFPNSTRRTGAETHTALIRRRLHQNRRVGIAPGMREEHIHYSTAIIGAGPYGLAIAARLKAAKTDFVLLGRPMGFWRESVPCGTRLLSTPASCSLSDAEFDYRTYANGRGRVPETMAENDLVDYCLWFQRQACGDSVEQEVVELVPRNSANRFLAAFDEYRSLHRAA